MKVELILDADKLYRRFPGYWLKDDNSVSSAAFQNTSNTNDMSVDLGRRTTSKRIVSGYPSHGVASFIAGLARKLGQKVLHDPFPNNPAHSTVRGEKTRGIRRQLAKSSTVVLLPED